MKLEKSKELFKDLDMHSTPYQILYHFSITGVTTKQIIDTHHAEEIINPNAKNYLSKITWQDICKLSKEELKQLKPLIILDWNKITNSNISKTEIEKLFE